MRTQDRRCRFEYLPHWSMGATKHAEAVEAETASSIDVEYRVDGSDGEASFTEPAGVSPGGGWNRIALRTDFGLDGTQTVEVKVLLDGTDIADKATVSPDGAGSTSPSASISRRLR